MAKDLKKKVVEKIIPKKEEPDVVVGSKTESILGTKKIPKAQTGRCKESIS